MHTTTEPILTQLEDILTYRHPGVIRRYLKEHGGTQAEAEEVFRETLKWLFLCLRAAAVADGPTCAMTPDIVKIDWMWHEFLLFTRDYAEFCNRHFGEFIHHLPEWEDPARSDEGTFQFDLARQFGLVYDELGEETLIAWYDECRYAASDRAPEERLSASSS